MPDARLHLQLLGPFHLRQGGQPVAGFDQARLQQLLAYLVLHRAAPISRQQLAFVFWPDSPDQQALKNFRTLLTRLRHALPDSDHSIEITAQTIQWRRDAPLTLDVAEFEAAMHQAAEAEASGERAAAVSAFAAAVAAYTGDLLPDCYDDWTLPLRERVHQTCGDALERLVLLLEEERDYGRAIPYAKRLLQHDPLHEPAYRHLMRLHLALGERADARRVYNACETMLKREFDAAPGRATRNIYERLISMEDRPGLAIPGRSPQAQPADLPLVGRKAEWARLLDAWHASAAGRPQMLLLTGEAGIGKTRLAEELHSWVARQGATTAAAHCYPQAGIGGLAYAPVAEWLSDPSFRPSLAGLDDVWLVEVARILPTLLTDHPHLRPPGPLTEPWQRTRLFEALARAMLGPAPGRGAPRLLFLDDLQWADRETLDWLSYILHYSHDAPLLILATVRGHEVSPDHPLTAPRLALTRAGLSAEIPLVPLDATDTARLAASVAGRNVEAGEAERIFHDSEGNPLFVVEMVRAGMGDREAGQQGEAETLGGLAQGGETRAGLARDAEPGGPASGLPPKVRAMIQWRLALLSPVAQTLAQTAAVIGRRFSFDVLVQASDQDATAVAQGLDELWQRQLVREQGADSYDFSHDGIRAVACDEISPIHRRGVHLRVAQALESLHDNDLDALSGQIAAHYEQAGQTQPAIKFYRRAATAAQRIYANDEAVRLYHHLLEGELRSGLSAADTCEVRLALAEVWRVTGRWARAQTLNREVMAQAEVLDDARLLAQAQRALADVLHLLGYYDEALEWLARAEQGFKATGEWRGVVSALWTMGQIYWFKGDHPQALAVLERQRQIATEIGDQRGICEALETTGMIYWSQGDWERSADCCLQAIRIAGPLEHQQIITRASITLGNVRSSQHWFGEAVYWYLHAGVLAKQIDDRRILSWSASNIALVLAKRGDYLRAISGYERSLRNAWEIGDRWTACLNVAGLAAVNERLGRVDLAESLYRKAIGFGQRLVIPSYLSGMLVSLARLLLTRGRAAEARDFYGEAMAKISSVAGERLAGEDTRFDARLLGVRLRCALGESSVAEAAAELRDLLRHETAPHRQAELNYELWRLAPGDDASRSATTAFYRSEHAETGAEECRERYRQLTGETLLDPPPLPDVSELIPDHPGALDLARVLAELETSFNY